MAALILHIWQNLSLTLYSYATTVFIWTDSQSVYDLSEIPESHPSSTQVQSPVQRVRTQANLKWIQTVQQQSFSAEIQNMKSSKFSQLPQVRQLRLFIDKGRLIHCGSRIHNAPVSELVKFSYSLPPKHSFTNSIVYAAHQKHLHSGVNSTLTAI